MSQGHERGQGAAPQAPPSEGAGRSRAQLAGLRAAIVAIGSELTSGVTPETNSAWIARRLREHGVETARIVLVPDELAAIEAALEQACAAASLVIVTGGLGPTLDDRTREAAARLAGQPLVEDPAVLAALGAWYQRRGRPLEVGARRQALLPRGARLAPNPVGTAPAFVIETGSGTTCWFLPGVPEEMRALLEDAVLPELRARGAGRPAVLSRELRAFGLTEAQADARLAPLFPGPDPELAFSVEGGLVRVRLTVREPDPQTAARRLEQAVAQARAALGEACFTDRGEGLAEVVLAQLVARGLTVGFAESCTGGLATHLLAAVPGASAALVGAIVAYADRVKAERLGVAPELLARHGAVSEPCARAMARGALQALGADVAAAITGIAGPQGGSADKPVGTVYVAVAGTAASGLVEACRRWWWPGARGAVQLRAALAALDMLRRGLGGRGRD
ncbi:MAG: CinA-like protein [Planctomycetota bacterium]|nr:MAG: CinA-like protein [Planctomycetota bacterium]